MHVNHGVNEVCGSVAGQWPHLLLAEHVGLFDISEDRALVRHGRWEMDHEMRSGKSNTRAHASL